MDDLTREKGIDPIDNKRPNTAAPTNNFGSKRESLWSAGGPNNRNQVNNQGTGSKYGIDDDDDLDALGDDNDYDDALGIGLGS